MKSSVHSCCIVDLPKVHNRAGNITDIANTIHVPFEIKRVYYLYDVPGGANRGGHAHKKLQQFVVAVSGSFDILLDDGSFRKIIHLDKPYYGLYIVPGIWRELLNFSSGAICLVLASEIFSENDYLRDYNYFITTIKV